MKERTTNIVQAISVLLIVLIIIGLIVNPILTIFLALLILLIAAACRGGRSDWRTGRRRL